MKCLVCDKLVFIPDRGEHLPRRLSDEVHFECLTTLVDMRHLVYLELQRQLFERHELAVDEIFDRFGQVLRKLDDPVVSDMHERAVDEGGFR